MKESQSRNSWFVSKFGLVVLLFFAVLAIYFQVWVIGAFLCFVFLLCLGSGMWSNGVLKRVDFTVDVVQGFCHAGDLLKLKLNVRNRSFLPLVWLDILLPTGKKPLVRLESQKEVTWIDLDHGDRKETGIRERFAWLLWQQEISWEETLRSRHRGVVEVTGAGLQAGDGFGLSAKETWKPFAVPFRLVIYPRLVPVMVQPFLKITQEAVAESRGQTEDITILKSSRPYQPGDPMKRINWRLLAGSQRMEVNVYETVLPGCAAFVLDLKSFSYAEDLEDYHGSSYKKMVVREQELEAMLSLIASCIQSISEQGILTALIIPAYRDQEAVFCIPGGGESALQRSMEALAMVDYQAEEVRFPYEEFWQINHKLGNVYICSWSEAQTSLAAFAEHIGRSRAKYLVMKRECSGDGEMDCLYAENIALEQLTPDGKEGMHHAETNL